MNLTDSHSELINALHGIPWPSSLRQILLSWCTWMGEAGYLVLVFSLLLVGISLGLWLLRRFERRTLRLLPMAFYSSAFSLLIMLVMRLPTLVPLNLSTDEDFIMTGVIGILKHGSYFGVIDGTTSGPLNFFLPALIPLLGVPLDSASIRVLSILLLWAVIPPLFYLVTQISSARTAFYAVITTAVLWGSLTHVGWVFYTSEHVSMMLIGWALCLLITGLVRGRFSMPLISTLAMVLAILPLTKLQAAPFVPLFLGWLFLCLFFWRGRNQEGSVMYRVSIFTGAVLLTLLPFSLIYIASHYSPALERFWISYVVTSVHICNTMAQTLADRVGMYLSMFERNPDLLFLLALSAVSCLSVILYRVVKADRLSPFSIKLALLLASAAGAGLLISITPGRDFTHYLQYLFFPIWLALPLMIAAREHDFCEQGVPDKGMMCSSLLLPCFAAMALIPSLWSGHPVFRQIRNAEIEPVHQTIVAQAVASMKRPEDELVVWGWCSQIHTQAQIAPGTNDIITERHIIPLPVQSLYRDWYLEEIKSRRPAFFVDSVGDNPCGMGYRNRGTLGHEVFVDLRRIIERDYQFFYDQEQLRLYVSLERFSSLMDHDYLFPLLVYLELTARGTSAYISFEELFQRWIERERLLHREQRVLPRNQVREILHATVTKVLGQLVSTRELSAELADSVREKAALRVARLSRQESTPTLELRNPIRMYFRMAEPWRTRDLREKR